MKALLFGARSILNDLFGTPQKSASGIQAIPHDNRIYVRYAAYHAGGYYYTGLYYKWWTSVDAMIKTWDKADIEEFVRAEHGGIAEDQDFWVFWSYMQASARAIYIDKFIQAHEPMIRKELDEHYAKNSEQL